MTRSASRSSSCIAIRLRTSRWTSSITRSSGSERSRNARASGRAADSSALSRPSTRSSHQRAASGNESSRSVSPVGAQSTTIASHSPDSAWRLSWSRLNSSSAPGGTVSSSAAIRSTPRSASTPPSHSCAADQLRSISSCACTCCAHTPPSISTGSEPTGACSDSASECAGSVESTSVREPAAAHRRAVAAATDVLPDAALARVEDDPGRHWSPATLVALLALRLQHLDGAGGGGRVAGEVARRSAAPCTVPARRGTSQPKVRLP